MIDDYFAAVTSIVNSFISQHCHIVSLCFAVFFSQGDNGAQGVSGLDGTAGSKVGHVIPIQINHVP